MNKTQRKKFLLIYTVVFAAVCCVVYMPFLVKGKTFIWEDDGLYQHFNAFIYWGEYLRDSIHTIFVDHSFDLPMWSFNIGMGGDIYTTLSYYAIGDVFSWISVFFKPENAEIGYVAAIILRLYFAGIAFSLYCSKMGVKSTHLIAGSISYVFCGWSLVASVRHPFFTGALLFLPLILFAIEKVIRKESPLPLTLIVFSAAVNNYYFFFMEVCITVLYVAVRLLCLYKKDIKGMLGRLGKIALYSVLGVACAACALVPMFYAVSASSRNAESTGLAVFYSGGFYTSVFSSLLTADLGKEWFVAGFTPVAMLGFFSEFVCPKKQNLWRRILSVVLFVLLMFPVAGYLISGMSYANDRWIFGFILIAVYMFADNIENLLMQKKKFPVLCLISALFSVATVVFSFVGDGGIKGALKDGTVAATVILIVSLAVIFVFRKACSGRAFAFNVSVAVLSVLGLASMGYFKYIQSGYADEFIDCGEGYNSLYNKYSRAADSIDDDGFYRVDTCLNDDMWFFNYPLASDFNTTAYYWSLFPDSYGDSTYANLSYNILLYKRSGYLSRAWLMPAACAEYFITAGYEETQVPYGFYEYSENSQDGTKIYKTDNVLPFGFTYDRTMSTEKFYSLSVLDRQQAMLEYAVTDDEEISVQDKYFPAFSEPEKLEYTVMDILSTASVNGNTITVTKSMTGISLDLTVPANTELYVYIEGLEFSGSDAEHSSVYAKCVSLTDEEHPDSLSYNSGYYVLYNKTSYHYHSKEGCLIDLSYCETPRTMLTLTFSNPGVYTFDSIEIYSQEMTGFEEAIEYLSSEKLENINFDSNSITGQITVNEPKILCLSIPFSEGWSAEVDGAPADLYTVNIMYTGLSLDAGEHTVLLKYKTPGKTLGNAISVVGLWVFVVCCIVRKRRCA